MRALSVALNTKERACHTLSARFFRAVAQEGVEIFAINHAHKAVFNRDIYFALGR